ncbi:MAG TPA: HEAT repeat domain-containing protein [Pirellulales bacterium]|jgi:HEAT repeat protein|nr:HEAT repeat domain-containing protein [Pirellulales bacterium]
MIRFIGFAILCFALTTSAQAYVDITPSLGSVINDAQSITVLKVEKVSRERQIVVYKKVADLKGETADTPIRHRVAHGFHPREPRMVLEWAEPGEMAICFTTGGASVVCTGHYWYQCAALEDHWWTMTTGRPELSLAYYGQPEKLREQIPPILAGKEQVVTVVSHGSNQGIFQYNNVAYQKVLRGRDCPVWRIRASLKMPERVWEVGDKGSPWVVGPGAAGPEDVPALIASLQAHEARMRLEAAEELGLIGAPAQLALAPLERAFHDPDPLVRASAARASALIGDEDGPALAELERLLRNESAAARKAAAIALGDLGNQAKSAVGALREAMSDQDPLVKWAVAEALGRIGPDAAPAIPALAAALRDPACRVMAADALGAMGTASRGAVPLLLDGLRGEDPDFRWTSAVALTRIDAKTAREAIPVFVEQLKKGDHRARWDALMYISPMGLEAIDAAPAVRAIVLERGNGVAAETLAAIAGPAGIDALPVLLEVLADDWDTTASIAKLGPKAIPAILAHLNNPQIKNRALAVKALELLAPQSKEAAVALGRLVQHADPEVRSAAEASVAKLAGGE